MPVFPDFPKKEEEKYMRKIKKWLPALLLAAGLALSLPLAAQSQCGGGGGGGMDHSHMGSSGMMGTGNTGSYGHRARAKWARAK